MSARLPERGRWRPWAPWVALLLWIATVPLGMQATYDAYELFLLVCAQLGVVELAQNFATVFICVMGLVMIAVILGSAEYHRTRVDQPGSWRLFAWTLGGELAIVLLHAFLID